MNKRQIKDTFVKQFGQSDCGVACLLSIIKFHGGSATLDYVRQLSGTTKYGTNLLGLKEASQSFGFESSGLVANSIDNLKEFEHPAILHIVLPNNFQHYIVFYRFEGEGLLIGDPQSGVKRWSRSELENVWQTKALLRLTPSTSFTKSTSDDSKLKWIWSALKEDVTILGASVYLGVILAVFSIASAVFTQQLIDKILPSKDVTKLILGLILFGSVLLIKTGLGYVRGLFLLTQSREFNKRIIKQFYSALLFLPKSFFDSKKTGELVSRMNDTSRIQMVISNFVANVIIELLVVIISLAAIFVYNVQMGLIVLAMIPISLIILFFFTKSVLNNQTEVMGLLATNESNYIDTITGIAEIKSGNKQGLFASMTSTIYENLQNKLLDFGKIKMNFSVILELTSICLLVASISYSSYLVFQNQIKVGELVAILSLIGTIIPILVRSAGFYIQLQEAIVAFNRMREFTGLQSEKNELDFQYKANNIGIVIENLCFKYPGTISLLENINLSIESGKLTVLIGESGSGKSTLLQIIQRFYIQQKGSIYFEGVDISNYNPSSIREHIRVIPQDVKIFNNNLAFNIALSDNIDDINNALIWCKENGLDLYFARFPSGYNTMLGEDGINVSGGQKQLIAFARALHKKPKMLIIDEGTSSMDRETENFILILLLALKKQIGIFLITHRIKTASKADVVYVLESGKISISGSPRSLLESDNFYSRGHKELLDISIS